MPEPGSPHVLALDTALNACTVALAPLKQGAAGQAVVSRSEPVQRGHAEVLFPMIESVTAEAGVQMRQVARIVATTGPGHFSGARVGLAAARSMALALGCPCIGVSTLQVLLAMLPGDGLAASAIDARRGEVFLLLRGGEPALVSLDEAAARLRARQETADGLQVIGSGAPLVREWWDRESFPGQIEVDRRTTADPKTLLQFAAADPAAHPPKPLYLRAPDATLPQPVPWANAL